VAAAADQSSNEGAAHSFDLGSFTDPGADNPWTVDVNWGDSHSDSFTMGAPGTIPAHSHTYDDNGSYTVTVKVTDKDSASDSKTFKVDVANVAPTADLANDGPVNEGSPVTVKFDNQHDASSADTSAGFHYAFDCNGGSLAGATYGGSGTSASTSCTFNDNGTYPVTGRIIDKDGGATEYTTNTRARRTASTLARSPIRAPTARGRWTSTGATARRTRRSTRRPARSARRATPTTTTAPTRSR
jgi:hypothetical protein